MASGDRRVSELPAATVVLDDDLFVLEQNDEPKSLSGAVLLSELLKRLEGHGGIQSFEKTGTAGLVDTYTITFVDGSTKVLTVTNGEKGDKGDPCYVWIKYASQEPTEESHSMSNSPDDWIGIYAGFENNPPSDWKQYAWFKIKGDPGESIKGDPGETPQLRIGTVTTVEFDQPASATISGTKENPVLNLMIPAGQPGANGENSADWSENYSNNPGYVLHRTHYVKSEETPFAGISVTFGATPYADFSTDLLTDNLGYHILYRVRFDGKEYFCQSRDLYAIRNTHMVAIGNCHFVDSYCEDTGEPFLIELYTSEKGSGRISCPGYANKTVEVIIDKAEDVYKLDNKYLDAVWTAEKHYRGVDGLLINYKKIEFASSNTVYNGVPNYWLDEGGKYDVYWNRQLYECVCFNRDGALYLGNGSLAGETGGEEAPFCFVSFGGSSVFVYKDTETAETVDITVIGHRETLMEKIPKEFLPDDLGGTGGGVNVTGATLGQMIIVKAVDNNGKPTEWEPVSTLPNGLLPDGVPYIESNGVLLEESEATSFTHQTFGQMWGIYEGIPDLKVGETYTVTYNGTPYECVCQTAPSGLITDTSAVAMGNFSVVGGADTGEPFAMLISYTYQEIDIIDLSGASAVKVKICGTVYHKITTDLLPKQNEVYTVKFEIPLTECEKVEITADKTRSEIQSKILDPNVFIRGLIRNTLFDGSGTSVFLVNSTSFNLSGAHDVFFSADCSDYDGDQYKIVVNMSLSGEMGNTREVCYASVYKVT